MRASSSSRRRDALGIACASKQQSVRMPPGYRSSPSRAIRPE
jgi:hypothetical protein